MRTSKEFYTKLNPEGLADRKKAIHTKKELAYLKKILGKTGKILDIGCGYGRFTILLAKQGYDIEGIDITPALIKKAKKDAKENNLKIDFKIGDMRDLPYKDNSFNNIICMWSVFIELSEKVDQLKAVKEMMRVLKSGGFALIEMPKPEKTIKEVIDIKRDVSFKKGNKKNILHATISGIEAMPSYRHNKKTLTDLIKKTSAKKFKVFIDEFGGRDRLFLQFWK